MSESVEVRIQGQVFRLKTDIGKEYAQELASFVDGAMKTMQRQSVGTSIDRIAIMAALGIADNLLQLQRQSQSTGSECASLDRESVDRVQRLIVAADRLLEER
ncbi:MAG: cell division protein ZapA [Magnetococcales bacterium]|nr:cell division protein ZapA [Magnetococcales bacterium]